MKKWRTHSKSNTQSIHSLEHKKAFSAPKHGRLSCRLRVRILVVYSQSATTTRLLSVRIASIIAMTIAMIVITAFVGCGRSSSIADVVAAAAAMTHHGVRNGLVFGLLAFAGRRGL